MAMASPLLQQQVPSLQHLLLLVLLPLLLTLLLFYLTRRHRPPPTPKSASPPLPPSPPFDLPILGHLLLLLPRFPTTSFADRYHRLLGPIFSLRFGSSRVVFVNSESLIREALLQKGSLFASRYQSPSVAFIDPNYRAIGIANGAVWATARRNLAQHTLAAKTLPAFVPARKRALDFMIDRLCRESVRHGGTVTTAFMIFRMAIIHFTISVCFGYTVDDEKLLSEISETLEDITPLFYALYFADLYPMLRPLILPTLRRKAKAVIAKQSELLIPLILRHQEKQKSLTDCDFIPGNYLESLLPQMGLAEANVEPGSEAPPPLTMTDVVTLCIEFLEASIGFVAGLLEWTMAHLVKDPAIQQKLYDHICDVTGGDRLVNEDDLPKLPYLQAVITETLRRHTPAPFLLPRHVTESCELGGYSIPKGTMVNFYVTGLAMDPEVWENPTEYRPERMMGVEVDMTGTRKITMLPFGAGRRMCAGMTLARMNMEMIVARLVQEFEWKGEGVDMTEKSGRAVYVLANPLRAQVRRRKGQPIHI